MKKFCLLLTAVVLAATLLAGCSSGKKSSEGPKGMYLQYNDAKIAIGMKFEDVKDGLGTETRTPEVILPCDGGDAYKDTLHFYPGMAVTENIDGVISQIEVSDLYEGEANATVSGKVKVGDTVETAVGALGEPVNYPIPDDEYSMTYNEGDANILLFLDPDNKDVISGIWMTLVQPMP